MMHFLSIRLFAFMPMLFFIYGLSFFVLGAAIAVEGLSLDGPGPPMHLIEFIRSSWGSLALFGILYGVYEFMGTLNILYGGAFLSLKVLRFLVLPLSYYFLCRFGASGGRRLEASGPCSAGVRNYLPEVLVGLWLLLCLFLLAARGFGQGWMADGGTASRYLLGFPGSLMAAFALASSAKYAAAKARKYLLMASVGFVLFATGLLIASKGDFFPMSVLNYESFYRAAHFPVEVFRLACTLLITFALLMFFRLLRDFASIRFKAILHVIMAVAIPALCFIVLVSYLMAGSLLKLSYKDNERITALTAQKMWTSFQDVEDSIKYNLLFAHGGATFSSKEAVMGVFADNADVTGITFYDGKGEILRAAKNSASEVTSYGGTAWEQRMRAFLSALTPKTALADFHLDVNGEGNLLEVFPVPSGRVEVNISLERLFMNTKTLRMEKRWHVLLLDDKGRVIMHGSGSHLLKNAMVELPGIGRGEYGGTSVENGVLYNAIEEEIGTTGWHLATEIPREDIVAPVFHVFKGLVFGIFGIYLLAFIFSSVAVRKVTRSINLIADRVKSIGRGDLASAARIRTGDEIETLSEEVEKMALMLIEKKRLERQMMQTQKIASLGRLVAGVAHEINNPLSVIIWTSQLLLKSARPEDGQYDDLRMIEKHALGCKKIVDDLLRFSRRGKQTDVLVDVNTNIEETLSLIGKQTKGNISLALDFDPLSPKVKGDPDKLRQVFLNMAVNAVDAMKNNGGTLTVRTRLSAPGPERAVEISFTDTGCGISPEDMERIFDPFFTTKKAGEGTGLGLSVSYGIVEACDGTMWAESEEGKGSTFHIVLPAAE